MSTLKFVVAVLVFILAAFVASCAFNGTRLTTQTMEDTVFNPTYDVVSNWHVKAVGDPWSNEPMTILEAANIAASRKALQGVEGFNILFDEFQEEAEKMEDSVISAILLDW
jgi:hypothetical protein